MSRNPESILQPTYIEVPLVIANDYDGVLGKTGTLPSANGPVEGAMGLFLKTATAEPFGLKAEDILSQWQEAEASGGSFDSLSIVRNRLTADEYELFCQQYIENKHGIDILYPDANTYLSYLNTEPVIPNLTLTYGMDPWQPIKTTTSNIPGHVEISAQKEKGPVIDSWRGSDGLYEFAATSRANKLLAIVKAKSVKLIDDKAAAFEGLPDDCSGVMIVRPGEIRKTSQAGEIDPRQVDTRGNLHELTKKLNVENIRPNYTADQEVVLSQVNNFVPLTSFILRHS